MGGKAGSVKGDAKDDTGHESTSEMSRKANRLGPGVGAEIYVQMGRNFSGGQKRPVDFPQRSKFTENCTLTMSKFYVLQIYYSIKLFFKKGRRGGGEGASDKRPRLTTTPRGLVRLPTRRGPRFTNLWTWVPG